MEYCSVSYASLARLGPCCWLLLLWALSASLLLPVRGEARVPAVYVFGDSLADVGNNNHLPLSLLKANFPHNGIDYPGRKPTGRFSNGKNTADFLAEKVGLPTSPPYLSLKSSSNNTGAFLQGVSFASGGAGVFDTTNKGQCITLDKQIEYYSSVYGALVQQLGSPEAHAHLSKSLFAVVIGSNDLLGYFKPDSKPRQKANPQQYVSSMISTIRGQLRRIYNLGARKLVVVGTGPIGCTPSQRNQNKTNECNAEANYWSVKFGEGVRSTLQGMKSELPDLNYSFFDATSGLVQYIQNPAKYGFVEVEAACCGLGNLNADLACLPIAIYCKNRADHIFWDFYHPSEATARLLVDELFDGSEPHVFPINGRQLSSL